jgi:glycerate dehydrogenase
VRLELLSGLCYWNTPLIELAGKTFGVIGYGRIGRAAAKLAAAFGMEVLAFDKFAQDDGVARMVTLDELLAQSDVISLHCPLFPDTQGIINRESIAKMKGCVMHINTPRAPDRGEDLDAGAAQRQGGGRAWMFLAVEPARMDNRC